MDSDFIRTSFQAIALCVAAIGSYGQTTISSLPFTITQSGTYTFSKVLNFSSVGGGLAITIAASNVVIDLKGYELKANPTGAGRGIESSNRFVNLIIRNGTISGFQFGVAVLNVTSIRTVRRKKERVHYEGRVLHPSSYLAEFLERCSRPKCAPVPQAVPQVVIPQVQVPQVQRSHWSKPTLLSSESKPRLIITIGEP